MRRRASRPRLTRAGSSHAGAVLNSLCRCGNPCSGLLSALWRSSAAVALQPPAPCRQPSPRGSRQASSLCSGSSPMRTRRAGNAPCAWTPLQPAPACHDPRRRTRSVRPAGSALSRSSSAAGRARRTCRTSSPSWTGNGSRGWRAGTGLGSEIRPPRIQEVFEKEEMVTEAQITELQHRIKRALDYAEDAQRAARRAERDEDPAQARRAKRAANGLINELEQVKRLLHMIIAR